MLLMNVYTHGNDPYTEHETHIIRLKVGGLTWGSPSTIPVDDGDETGLLSMPSGTLLAAVRRTGPDVAQHVCVTSSSDGGYAWSEPRAVTGPMQIPADLIRLADGRVLMAFGHRNAPFGVRALVSRDEGETWDHENAVTLVDDSLRADCDYPGSIQLDDCSIFTAFYAYESAGPFRDRRLSSVYGMNYDPHCAGVKYEPEALH